MTGLDRFPTSDHIELTERDQVQSTRFRNRKRYCGNNTVRYWILHGDMV